jgi:tetratricopeptide (TPR) repeat protein
VNAGFVTPSRGERRQLRFSFQDLIVMRAARSLIEANIPRRRILRSLEELRRHLPADLPLSGLSIRAIGDRVVVRDGTVHWQADDGQYVLGLDVEANGKELRVVEHKSPQKDRAPAEDGEALFNDALVLEESSPEEALRTYQRAVKLDACNIAAWNNWGRLLHEQGKLREAERTYRHAFEACGPDALLMFNLGVVLDDLGEPDAAMDAYRSSIEDDPTLADAHYNLARLYEAAGMPQHAIRHYGQYRRLTVER